jgi:hypothetical protein
MSLSRRLALARLLAAASARLLPLRRADWGAAIRAEVEAIDDPHAALSFSLGCVQASLHERISDMLSASKHAKLAVAAPLILLAAAGALSGWRAAPAHAPTAIVFALNATVFALAASMILLRGTQTLGRVAGILFAAYAIAFVVLDARWSATEQWTNAGLYRALALEGTAIWAFLLAGAAAYARLRRARAEPRSSPEPVADDFSPTSRDAHAAHPRLL